jgi:hypothetical protein
VQANTRLAVTSTALGTVVVATLASLGCNDPAADALSSALKPPTSKYSVGGSVSGLSGSGLVLEDNGGDDLAVAANGTFTFPTALAVDASYSVTVKTQPSAPAQTCTLGNASGTVASANVTSVSVTCTNNPMPAVTSVGSAVGNPSSKLIDATGGSITSDDARLTVTVPAGAVAAATAFTIQPINNEAPGGIGNAYRLGPAGMTFSTPVSISFHYSSADLAGTVADALSLGYQDGQDRWVVGESVTVDTSTQTVMVSSDHFSDWAPLSGLLLEPAVARIGTSQTQTLTLSLCDTIKLGEFPFGPYAISCQQLDSALLAWSANGIAGGNSAVGTVVSAEPGNGMATYTAPAQVPASNPVAVSVSTPVINLRSGKLGKEIAVSNITIGGCSLATAQDCTYVGTSATSTARWKATAQVTWKFQSYATDEPNVVNYVPVSGTVTLTDLQTGCRVDSAPQPITSAKPSILTIDYSQNPPRVGGNGTNLSGWTEMCTPPANPPPEVGAVWWADGGSDLSPDGSTIAGDVTTLGAITSQFSFTVSAN